jgi:phosphoglycerate dehydrogenase-like enzyme
MADLQVHFPGEPGADSLAHLRERLAPGVRLTVGKEPPDPAEYEVLVAGRPTGEQLAASPRLRALIIPWAGLPESTREAMRELPAVAVHNLHHNAAPTAEMAAALLLAAAKRIVPLDRSLRAHDWSPRYESTPSLLLEGRRALVLGYGAVGRRVARICRGLGMRVSAVRRRAGGEEAGCPDEVHPAEALHDLLPGADAVVVALPLTRRTEGFLGERELGLLPRHAVLVNVGRGPVVDEAALYRALRDGGIGAAGLDVWYRYPPGREEVGSTSPSEHPFGELDNVVLSPHRAGDPGVETTERRRMEALAASLNAAAAGGPIPHPVDLDEGY